jgi:hypothetical protein
MTASIIDIRLLDRARTEIGKEIEARQEQIASGLASDFPDYRYRVGQINGLTTALEMLGEIVKSMGDGRP